MTRDESNVKLTRAERRSLERVRDTYRAMATAVDLVLRIDSGELQELGDNFARLIREAQGIPAGRSDASPPKAAESAPAQSERRRRRGRIDEDPHA